MSAIVKFYVKRILQDKMTIDDVPEQWREEVRQALEELGGGTNE